MLDGGPDVLAVGLTAAVAVQLERHHGDSPTLQWLVGQTDAPDAGRGRSPYAAYRRLSQASSDLANEMHRALDPYLRPSDRLRYGTCSPAPRQPVRLDLARRAATVPATLWPEVALSLLDRDADRPWLCATLAALTLLPGSVATYADACHALENTATAKGLAHLTSMLIDDRPDGSSLTALVALRDWLDREPPPVDYARRRALATRGLPFDRLDWDAACRAAGWKPTARRATNARRLLWQTITGGDPHRAPFGIGLRIVTSEACASWHRFRWELPPAAWQHLRNQARNHLDASGLADEPLDRTPDADWVDKPEKALNQLDRGRLEQLALEGVTPGRIAAELGVPLERVRLTVETQPLPWPYERPCDRVTPEALAAAAAGRPARQVAADLGVSRQQVVKAMRLAEVPVGPVGAPVRHHVDPVWLRRHYETLGRPLPSIAADFGCSPANLALIARAQGLAIRKRGGGSHAHALDGVLDRATVPDVLWKAFAGQGGEQRIRRFIALAQYDTLSKAAVALGCSQGTLTLQVAALEKITGHRLLRRAERGRPLAFTPAGSRFAEQARGVLSRLDPGGT